MNTAAAIDPRHAAGQRLRERVFRAATFVAALLVLTHLGGVALSLRQGAGAARAPGGRRVIGCVACRSHVTLQPFQVGPKFRGGLAAEFTVLFKSSANDFFKLCRQSGVQGSHSSRSAFQN